MRKYQFCPNCGVKLEHYDGEQNCCPNCGSEWVIREASEGAGTPSNNESLTRLIEECSEVIKVAAKIKRFGQHNYHPYDKTKTTNLEILQIELADLLLAIDTVVSEFTLVSSEIAELYFEKRANITKWLIHVDIENAHSFIHACMKDLVRTADIEKTLTNGATNENLPGYSI